VAEEIEGAQPSKRSPHRVTCY